MKPFAPSRRQFLASTALAGTGLALPAAAGSAKTADFQYEVTRTDEEWRARLTAEQYGVMREGATELPRNGSLWQDYAPAEFKCRGCDLHVYASDWRVELDKGWIFFRHAQPNSILTSIDVVDGDGMGDDVETAIETHCRRCGSHLGHIVIVDGAQLHCINAASLIRELHAS